MGGIIAALEVVLPENGKINGKAAARKIGVK